MTDKKQHDALEPASAAESADIAGYPTAKKANAYCLCLLEDCAHMIRKLHAENESLRAERERNLHSIRVNNEIINEKNDELESLRTGYAAARLEIESLRARCVEPVGERTTKDYAIEHAEYMAQDAERLLEAINHLNAQRDEDGDAFDSDALAHAEEAVTEAFGAVRNGIYEFRKRRDRAAAQPAGAQQPGDCGNTPYDEGPFTLAQQPGAAYAALPDVDALAQEIRRVDGGHDLGAGALAEALMPFLRASPGRAPAQAAPAAGAVAGSGEVVAHRVVRKLNGEWASGALDWCDGPPSRALVDSIRADKGRWRIDVAYAAPAAVAGQSDDRVRECAARLVEHADFQLGGTLSADSKARDIPSRACSQVKARHLAALRDALAAAPTTQPAPQQEATDALARAEYYIDNPSAWSSFDQRISDDISAVTKALRAALAAPKPQQEAQEPVAWRELCRRLYVELFYCNQQMTSGKRPKWQQGKTVRDVLADAKAALDAAPQPSPASQGDVLDAARYRYLRDVPMGLWPAELLSVIRLQQNAKWDAAIDAAMNKGGQHVGNVD